MALLAGAAFMAGCSLLDLDPLSNGSGGATSASGAGPDPTGTQASASGSSNGGAASCGVGGQVMTGTYADEVLSDAPKIWWRLDEPPESVGAADSSGNDNGGAYVGDVKFGAPGALACDSDTAVKLDLGGVYAGDVFDFEGNLPYSLEAWIAADVLDFESRYVFNKGADDNLGLQQYGIFVQGATLGFERHVDSAPIAAFTAAPRLGQFTHVVGTYDGSALRLYVDGQLVDSAPDNRAAKPTTSSLLVGLESQFLGDFGGTIDEVAIYDKALSSERISVHYKAAFQ